MRIELRLDWAPPHSVTRKDFKLPACHSLFEEYVERINRFVPCKTSGTPGEKFSKERGVKIWVCEAGKGSQSLTSEEVSSRLGKVTDSGAKAIWIVIGGPDGFSREKLEAWQPDLKWSFGPLTLPHELAAVVAAEQMYRAWTILRRHPYHCAHRSP